jgi:hypothetical protein
MRYKHCKCCGKDVPEADFPRDASRPDGLGFYCKPCHAARNRRWAKDNPDKTKEAQAAWRKSQKTLVGP